MEAVSRAHGASFLLLPSVIRSRYYETAGDGTMVRTVKHDDEKRLALVTGGNRGIGLEIARQLARLGVRVIVGSRDAKAAKDAAASLAKDGAVFAESLDVTDPASIERAMKSILEHVGRVDVLVNNAGILIDEGKRTSTIPMTDAERTLDTNVLGAWRMSQAVLPAMRQRRYGRIVNVSSGMGMLEELAASGGTWPAYRLSKAALNALTILLASEVRGENILVNATSPGWVRTRMGGATAPRSVEQGADTPVWLATLPDGGPSGGSFEDRKPIAW
jgi:NAD(P)-dependent dehydrogenase (short-subunit alcohol dehydrogenase family)